MSEAAEQDDKSHDATERRIEQALERGDVPKSPELQSFLVLLAGCGGIWLLLAGFAPDLTGSLAGLLAKSHATQPDMRHAMRLMATAIPALAVPMLLLVAAGLASGLILHRPVYAPAMLAPKVSRIDPLGGAKRIFGSDNLFAFWRTLAKLAVLVVILAWLLWSERIALVRLATFETGHAVQDGLRIVVRLAGYVLALSAALALADAAYQMFAWKRRLRMTAQEVKDDQKETDGNPEVKARLRNLRQARARRRIAAAVPKASVIIVNPTHYAVALRYDKGMAAPVCVAKGLDDLALRIRAIAREHRIPVVENPPLARILHATVEIDGEIAPDHYKAVAEVIGFVMRGAKGQARHTRHKTLQ